MKTILIFISLLPLLGCNNPKAPQTAINSKKQSVTDSVSFKTDSVKPVFTARQEAKIKEDSLLRVKTKFPYLLKHPFESYKAPVFEGTPAAPDFKRSPYADDSEYIAFITKGCEQGINFGGHYTLIEYSIGAYCSGFLMVDRANGKIFTTDSGLGQINGYYGFAYKKDSYALITDATAIIDASTDQMGKDASIPMVYKWNGSGFIKLK